MTGTELKAAAERLLAEAVAYRENGGWPDHEYHGLATDMEEVARAYLAVRDAERAALERAATWAMGIENLDLFARESLAAAIRALADDPRPICTFHPDADCTDDACPAWWRGHEHTAAVFCQLVNDILDGKRDGRGIANEPWESTKRRLLALVPRPRPESPP